MDRQKHRYFNVSFLSSRRDKMHVVSFSQQPQTFFLHYPKSFHTYGRNHFLVNLKRLAINLYNDNFIKNKLFSRCSLNSVEFCTNFKSMGFISRVFTLNQKRKHYTTQTQVSIDLRIGSANRIFPFFTLSCYCFVYILKVKFYYDFCKCKRKTKYAHQKNIE